ncbi:MAG: thiamine pyrophosphate-dependent dehydrogenase E1 component subunit alpha [Peptococcia bacterium]
MSKERYLKMYEYMLEARRLDEIIIELMKEGQIPGFVHAGIGHEAASVGTYFDLNTDDFLFPHHRCYGAYLAMGGEAKRIAADYTGKVTGYNKGKGGNHIAAPELGIYGVSGTLGSQMPFAVGAALTAVHNNKKQVAVCSFGDGTSNREIMATSLNMAATWNLPVVFVVENNGWGITTSIKNTTAVPNIADRAAGYGLPGITIDGTDILAVNETVNKAVERARNGEGPTLVECKCYRWHSHAEGLPAFAAEEDAQEGRKHDPLKIFRKVLAKKASKDEIAAVEAQVEERIKEAKEFAINSPDPKPEDALEDLLVGRKING